MRFGIRAWGWWGGHAQSEENTSAQPVDRRVTNSAGWYYHAPDPSARCPKIAAASSLPHERPSTNQSRPHHRPTARLTLPPLTLRQDPTLHDLLNPPNLSPGQSIVQSTVTVAHSPRHSPAHASFGPQTRTSLPPLRFFRPAPAFFVSPVRFEPKASKPHAYLLRAAISVSMVTPVRA